jgi:hypothetical protein
LRAEPVPLFSGSDSYVDLGKPDALQIPSKAPFTVEGWMLFDTLKSRDMLYCKSAGRTSAYSYMLGFADGKLAAYNTAWRGNFVVSRETNRWCHVAFSFDGTNMAFYLDGDLLGVAAFSFNNNLAHTVKIGGFSSTSDIDGSLSDVRVWSYARSQADLQGAMSNRLTGVESGLLGYWPLNEEGGATVYDQSANASDGEVIGAGWTHTDTLPLQPSAAGFEFFRPFVLADLETGSTRFTNSNEVDVIDLPVPEGCDGYQLNFLADAASLDPEAWSATNALPTRLSFARPLGDDDIHFYAWFTNTADTVTVRRSAARIRYTDAPPVPAVLPTHFRQKISGQPVTLLPAEIDNGSTGGESGGEAIPIHATRLALVSGPDTNATPDEPFVTVSELGTYAVSLVVMNAAGNVATSSVCAVTVTAYGGEPFVWTGAFDDDWHNPLNWNLHAVPVAGSEAVIGTGSVLLTNATPDLASFTMSGGTLTFSNWTACISATHVMLEAGTVTLPPAFTENQMSNRVWFVCTDFSLGQDALIDVSAQGYRSREGPGCGGSEVNVGAGAGYGGHGGDTSDYRGAKGGVSYGSIAVPLAPGSGGGSRSETILNGGAGGGAVRIEAAGDVLINGHILADGGNGYDSGGGGSGGSISIACNRFGGTKGKLHANGGDGATTSAETGGGGGGRIALDYQALIGSPDVALSARMGTHSYSLLDTGHPFPEKRRAPQLGTLYFSTPALLEERLRLSGGALTNVYGYIHFGSQTVWTLQGITLCNTEVGVSSGTVWSVEGACTLASALLVIDPYARFSVVGDLSLNANGSLRIYSAATNGSERIYGNQLDVSGALTLAAGAWIYPYSESKKGASVCFSLGSLQIMANGGIDAVGRGFARDYGEGRGTAGNTTGSGAGYGGRGGNTVTGAIGGKTYGSSLRPTLPGSGGGTGKQGEGGGGGGLLTFKIAGDLTLDGEINVGGGRAAGATRGGGGSGGAILIDCRTFSGGASGRLLAYGGDAATTTICGGGGGGRIAVWFGEPYTPQVAASRLVITETAPDSYAGSVSVANGSGYASETEYSEPGTVRFVRVLPMQGTLLLLR